MFILYKMISRVFQNIMHWAAFFIPYRKPVLIEGPNTIDLLPTLINDQKWPLFLATDQTMRSIGILTRITDVLTKSGAKFVIFDRSVPNPTIDNIEEALSIYQSNKCGIIIALGGGSVIDLAKAVGARVANPHKSIRDMRGVLRVGRKLPVLIAIPTTAGTGSETTLASVVTDSKTHEKYALNDPHLIPTHVILDPTLTINLPKKITAMTGLDALVHAVESYIGFSTTKETRKAAIEATHLIFANLPVAWNQPLDLFARGQMQKAAFLAGLAFSRSYVGNIHALAHPLSGFYQIPHGLANAVLMPLVLDFYGDRAARRLAQLARKAGLITIASNDQETAKRFIEAIRNLENQLEIPLNFGTIIQKEHIDIMSDRAFQEANPLYPVPVMMTRKDFASIYAQV